jgi:ectoine hydroxylase-related dioxygenase (phytanoyl-CoA dioxygenase family)
MSLNTVVKNARDTARIVKTDLTEYVARRRAQSPALAPEEQQLVEGLRRDGYAVVPGYWARERAIAMRDRLEAFLADGESKEFDSGAYLRFWDNRAHDEGVRRLYHVDREIPELSEYRNDPLIRKVVEAYFAMPFHSGVLVYQHNTKSNANTRNHHVDAFSKEFKSFLYLDDVDEGNGPFAYIPGTQRSHARRVVKQLVKGSEATGFTDQELGKLIDREVTITGEAGTLILADVRGFHRGTPQLNRSRSAIVNYMFKHDGEVELDR